MMLIIYYCVSGVNLIKEDVGGDNDFSERF